MEFFPKNVFVTGIGTGVGKTVTATILAKALKADYWKPVQTGSSEGTDASFAGLYVDKQVSKIHPPAYLFSHPSSPHYAARLENCTIQLKEIQLPSSDNRIVAEGAGGLLVPLNEKHTVADLILHLQLPAVLVASNYLGSINHTLLSIAYMRQKKIPLLGIIFNGKKFLDNEEIITRFSHVPVLGFVEEATEFNAHFFEKQSAALRTNITRFYQL